MSADRQAFLGLFHTQSCCVFFFTFLVDTPLITLSCKQQINACSLRW